jgi:hypothetical protein
MSNLIEPFPSGFDQTDEFDRLFLNDPDIDYCDCAISEEDESRDGYCVNCGKPFEK